MTDLPAKLAVDADGNGWRIWDDGTWGMVPVSPGQQAEPVVFYVPESALLEALDTIDRLRLEKAILQAALNGGNE